MPKIAALYDGNCLLCINTARVIRRLDWRGRIELSDVQDWSAVSARFPHLNREATLGAIHIITPQGTTLVGYEGMRHLAMQLPLTMWAAPLMYLPPIAWLGRRIYAWIARRRYAINRLFGRNICADGTCKMP